MLRAFQLIKNLVRLTLANIEYFSEGAGDDNENICELYADFIHQTDVVPTHLYDWDNPPGTGDQVAPWVSYHGYLLLTGYNPNTACENINDGFLALEEWHKAITIHGYLISPTTVNGSAFTIDGKSQTAGYYRSSGSFAHTLTDN